MEGTNQRLCRDRTSALAFDADVQAAVVPGVFLFAVTDPRITNATIYFVCIVAVRWTLSNAAIIAFKTSFTVAFCFGSTVCFLVCQNTFASE